MGELTIIEQETLEILRRLQRRCDRFSLHSKDSKSKVEIEVMATDIKINKNFVDIDNLYDIEIILKERGIDFSITFDLLNDTPLAHIDEYHPSEDFVQIGLIKGENIQDIKAKISDFIGELNKKDPMENSLAKNKKNIALPKFISTDWSKVEIRFITENDVYIKAGNKTVTADYEGLGFRNDKTGKPNVAWRFLSELAKNNGETPILTSPIPDHVKHQKQIIADRLKKIFKNDTDPFYDCNETKTYKIKITLKPPEEEDKKDNLGIEEYLKEVGPSKYESESGYKPRV